MNKKSVFALCLSLIAISLLVYTNIPSLVWAQPGDASDPLVTRRYVDNRISELAAQIARLEAMIAGGQAIPQVPPVHAPPAGPGQVPPAGPVQEAPVIIEAGVATVVPFQIYNVPAGRTIYFEAGAELLLRSGDVSAVTGYNGFIDITAGRDVLNGETIYHNHLHLVPVTDGRGLYFHTSGWIMIKGGYQVAN